MALLILAYLGGALTILSPCILPDLPSVLSRTGQPFMRGRLSMLAGMALTFAGVVRLASAGGAWAASANEAGRLAALILLAVFGLFLLWPRLADILARPAVALGNRLASSQGQDVAGTAFATPALYCNVSAVTANTRTYESPARPIHRQHVTLLK